MIKVVVVIAAAGLLLAGCGGSGGNSDGPPSTVDTSDTAKDGNFWRKLNAAQKDQVATFCRAQAATKIGEASNEPVVDPVYSQAYERAQSVDAALVVKRLDDLYSLSYERHRPIRQACSDMVQQAIKVSASGKLPRVHLTVNAPAKTSAAEITLSGTVTKGATVRVRESRLTAHDGTGWYSVKPASVKGTHWSARIALPSAGENDYRIDASADTYRPIKRIGDITRTGGGSAPATGGGGSSGGGGSVLKRFSGNGSTNLGRFTIGSDATLKWTNDGDLFSVIDDSGDIFIQSERHSGSSAVAAGSYTKVQVNAVGNWTIRIVTK
jgi:hypothetical protein